jgi:hypothetical protein
MVSPSLSHAPSIKQRAYYLARDAAKMFMRPREFVAHQTVDRREKLHGLMRALKWRDYRARAKALAEVKPAKPIRLIAEDQGFRWVDDMDPVFITAAKNAAIGFRDKLEREGRIKADERQPLVVTPLPLDVPGHQPILDLILHPAMVKMAADYIGTLPVLLDTSLLYSPNARDIPASSQYYHLDGQDVRTVLAYLFLHDVDAEGGPFITVTAHATRRIARAINYRKTAESRRVTDSIIDRQLAAGEKRTMTGPEGSLFVCDTDRCFHYGSRSASRPRYMLVFHYVSPAGFMMPWRYQNALPTAAAAKLPGLTRWQRLVLGG